MERKGTNSSVAGRLRFRKVLGSWDVRGLHILAAVCFPLKTAFRYIYILFNIGLTAL
jgi:hypothetical protein